jgi:hypothetical protein
MAYEPQSFEPWRTPPGGLGETQYQALLAHPRFAAAGRQLSRSMLDLATRDVALDGIVKDIGRFVATGLAVYLDATGGLTLVRLKELCARSGIASPGRARAILLYLRFLKYVAPVEDGGRAMRFVPTPALIAAYQTILRTGIDAAAVIEPGLERLSNRLGDPQVMAHYTRIVGEIGLFLGDKGSTDNALWRIFLNRHAGSQILHALMLAGEDRAHYPPKGEIEFSLSALARDLRVSRPHVARLLRAAEAEGLIALHGDNRLAFTEDGRNAVIGMLGARLAIALQGAIRLLDALETAPGMAS